LSVAAEVIQNILVLMHDMKAHRGVQL